MFNLNVRWITRAATTNCSINDVLYRLATELRQDGTSASIALYQVQVTNGSEQLMVDADSNTWSPIIRFMQLAYGFDGDCLPPLVTLDRVNSVIPLFDNRPNPSTVILDHKERVPDQGSFDKCVIMAAGGMHDTRLAREFCSLPLPIIWRAFVNASSPEMFLDYLKGGEFPRMKERLGEFTGIGTGAADLVLHFLDAAGELGEDRMLEFMNTVPERAEQLHKRWKEWWRMNRKRTDTAVTFPNFVRSVLGGE